MQNKSFAITFEICGVSSRENDILANQPLEFKNDWWELNIGRN